MPVVPSKDGDGYELLKIKPGNSTKVTDYTVLDNENFVEQVNRAVKNFHKQPEHKHDVDGGCVILFLCDKEAVTVTNNIPPADKQLPAKSKNRPIYMTTMEGNTAAVPAPALFGPTGHIALLNASVGGGQPTAKRSQAIPTAQNVSPTMLPTILNELKVTLTSAFSVLDQAILAANNAPASTNNIMLATLNEMQERMRLLEANQSNEPARVPLNYNLDDQPSPELPTIDPRDEE